MKFITVNLTKSHYKKILLSDILYVEAKGDYVSIYTPTAHYVTHSTLKNIGEVLGDSFYRIHRSFIVNKENVTDIKTSRVIVGSRNLPISENNKSDFLKSMNLISSIKEK